MKTDLDWEYLYRELELQLETILEAVARNMDELQDRSLKSLAINQLIVDTENNEVHVTCVASAISPEFSFELHGPNGLQIPSDFSHSNSHQFPLLLPGFYTIRCIIRETSNRKITTHATSESFGYNLPLELSDET